MKRTFLIIMTLIQVGCANDNYYYKNNQKVTITPSNSISRSNSNIDYYQDNQGIVLGVTDKLIVKLKDDKELEQILNEFNLTLEKTLNKNLYLLKTSNKNLTVDISNRLSEKEDIEYSHPDFIKQRMSR
ncbi:hypothetical protein KKG72_03505 [bacterium]|nr:hypothetical protein [bacterium]MBU1993759.1 hypothetical protein [bacterium]